MTTVEAITRTYWPSSAVDDLSFDVHAGGLAGHINVTGPSRIAEGFGLWALNRSRRTLTA